MHAPTDLRSLRLAVGLSQEALAREADLSVSSVRRAEHDIHWLSPAAQDRLVVALVDASSGVVEKIR